MTRQELPWLLLGLLLGFLLALWLSQHDAPEPTPPQPCAGTEPAPGKILDPFRELGKTG